MLGKRRRHVEEYQSRLLLFEVQPRSVRLQNPGKGRMRMHALVRLR